MGKKGKSGSAGAIQPHKPKSTEPTTMLVRQRITKCDTLGCAGFATAPATHCPKCHDKGLDATPINVV